VAKNTGSRAYIINIGQPTAWCGPANLSSNRRRRLISAALAAPTTAVEMIMLEGRIARDGEEFAVRSNGGDWFTAWHSPIVVPTGTPHGANGFCVTANDHVVLISSDGERWGWPGGRPEGDESWEQTLRREILEETCSIVHEARLLGFCRSVCLSGPEKGLVLVRSVWRAEVEIMSWEPRFEIEHRRVVPATDLRSHLWMEEGFEPIYRRALVEAVLMSRDGLGI
jgi:ADP-ribose pyrophosphatase YjhB (NUDIX family)